MLFPWSESRSWWATDLALVTPFRDDLRRHCWITGHRLPEWHSGKESACRCRRYTRLGFALWVRNVPCSTKWQSTPVFLLGKLHGQRSLAGYSPWHCKESDMTEHSWMRAVDHQGVSRSDWLEFWSSSLGWFWGTCFAHCILSVCVLSPVQLFVTPYTVAC